MAGAVSRVRMLSGMCQYGLKTTVVIADDRIGVSVPGFPTTTLSSSTGLPFSRAISR